MKLCHVLEKEISGVEEFQSCGDHRLAPEERPIMPARPLLGSRARTATSPQGQPHTIPCLVLTQDPWTSSSVLHTIRSLVSPFSRLASCGQGLKRNPEIRAYVCYVCYVGVGIHGWSSMGQRMASGAILERSVAHCTPSVRLGPGRCAFTREFV